MKPFTFAYVERYECYAAYERGSICALSRGQRKP